MRTNRQCRTPMQSRTPRRKFLGTAAAATGVAVLSLSSRAEDPKKLKLGLIGAGWYGNVDAQAALKAGSAGAAGGVEIAAVCDVDSAHLKKSADGFEKAQGKRPQEFKLYQELLDAKGLDAVIIATPPHWHALQFIAALEKNLDVYCEKPLGYDIREGRAMVDAAKKAGRIVQVGFQRRQSKAVQAVKEFIDAGSAGKIIQVDAQIHYKAGPKDPTPQNPPETLYWDLWCGPCPKIPYSAQVGHINWRLEKTSGHGHLVDWGIHLIDATRKILGETAPKRVTAAGGLYCLRDKITTPDILTVHFEFERCPVVWRHRIWGAEEYAPEVSNGIFLYGEKATIVVTDDRWLVIPAGKAKERQENKVSGDTGLAHMTEFLNAVRERKQPSCLIEDAHLSTTTVQLAMIAYETGSAVEWNAATEQIANNEAASKLLKREYREPWKHPYKG
ncbi:MAG: Gfo/Idh/MocA family oxidoreductase [Planctomycetota bacterium]|nr:Gfo/Idh/MocA family oxidoreductase [Planctomycetota bacterium]